MNSRALGTMALTAELARLLQLPANTIKAVLTIETDRAPILEVTTLHHGPLGQPGQHLSTRSFDLIPRDDGVAVAQHAGLDLSAGDGDDESRVVHIVQAPAPAVGTEPCTARQDSPGTCQCTRCSRARLGWHHLDTVANRRP